MAIPTPIEFRTAHGDPATWSSADHESYEHLAAIDAIAPGASPATVHLLIAGTTRSGKNTPIAPATAA
ncbi:hypothetical protein [Streptomyces sp. NPDC056169]|uniref:hypothetical protein n=1 Tax=Streptomyces sp. NPDC056169 TaxID=3345734 RepID=UPI0035DE9BCD